MMRYPRTGLVLAASLATVLGGVAAGAPALAASRDQLTVRHVGQISEQDVPPLPGSEPDTLVEPDVAVSPQNQNIAVAVSHDGRYPDGGAVSISYAWTHDGGHSWHHAPLPGTTKPAGGVWDRASDPVVTFGPDGTAYVSVLLIDLTCPAASVGVSRSTDGGRTFSPPVLVHRSESCLESDDKNWLVVDTSRRSPHYGRLYQFWSMFFSNEEGENTGAPQVVRWSDDRGQHWSDTVTFTATDLHLQNSQPMIQPDGTIIDTYLNFGHFTGGEEDEDRPGVDAVPQSAPRVAAEPEPEGDLLVARISRDGGRTWSAESPVTHDIGFGPDDIRCCLPSATADPVTGRLYVAWESARPEAVNLATSVDGQHWSPPIQVNHADRAGLEHVNVDVSAYGGRVFVSYGTRDTTVDGGRFVQQQLSASYDGGAHFGPELSIGPRSDLRYAAVAGGIFPGDYIGSAATRNRVYLVWCVSSTPPDPAARYHQTMFGAVLKP